MWQEPGGRLSALGAFIYRDPAEEEEEEEEEEAVVSGVALIRDQERIKTGSSAVSTSV